MNFDNLPEPLTEKERIAQAILIHPLESEDDYKAVALLVEAEGLAELANEDRA